MPQYVEVKGQVIEFPDGMSQGDIEATLKQNMMDIKPSTPTQEPGVLDRMLQAAKTGIASGALGVAPQLLTAEGRKNLGNTAGGFLSGAGTIGSTLIEATPLMTLKRAYDNGDLQFGDKVSNQTLSSLITGKTPEKKTFLGNVRARNAAIESGLQSMGADTGSTSFAAGKLGGQVAGTAGVGSALGALFKGAQASPALVNAITSSGMTAGTNVAPGFIPAAANMATRMAGGAITGGTSAALVDPESAGTGALIGGLSPVVIKAAGSLGKSIGDKIAASQAENIAKFNRGAPMRQTLKESIEAGYVVPPNMVNPSAKNAIIESFSGKQATSQIASVRNQNVTEKLVRQSLGLAEDAPLSKRALEKIREVEGGVYKQVGEISPSAEYDLEALKKARNEAQGWFNAYNRSASPDDLAKAKDFRDTAEMLEMRLESHAKDAGKDALIPALREARKKIAKTYTVQRALNDSTGTVNAKVIGRLFDKGKPLSDGLDTVGKFASGFPSIAQSPQQMGSPAAHNLRAVASMLAGGGGLATAGPLGLAAGVLPFAAGPVSRSIMFREGAQRALANQSAPTIGQMSKIGGLLSEPEVQMFLARTTPVTASYLNQ